MRRVSTLAAVDVPSREVGPTVSVVSPACDEQASIAGALVSRLWTGRNALLPALFPNVALLLVAFQAVRAGVLGRRLGGIVWRGVRYETAALRGVQRFRL